jgi:Zn-dependent peptidase ImmA (M78 family)
LGIKIRYKELGRQIKAFYFCQSRIKNIVVNKAADYTASRVLVAHELGHERLHTALLTSGMVTETALYDAVTPLEIEANTFAAELLIPDGDILSAARDGETFFDAARCFAVPPELLEFKLRALSCRGINLTAPIEAEGRFLANERLFPDSLIYSDYGDYTEAV